MKISPYYFVFLIMPIVFNSCDSYVDRPEDIPSEFFLELNQSGLLVNLEHKATGEQAMSDINIPNICNWLYNDCNKNNVVDTFYFASSFGNDVYGSFNFVITNFPYSENIILKDLTSFATLLKEQLPLDGNAAKIALGSANEGITTGNVFIGKPNYKHGYTINQNSSYFRITKIKDGFLYSEPVAIISFEFAYFIANENAIDALSGNSLQLTKGRACLPFGLHGTN